MSDSQWLWDPLSVCEMGPLREIKTCCGITKKGDACKLIVKKETLKEGRHKLNNLARGSFNLSTLDSQLSDLVSFFLCKQWHRERQHNDIKQRWFDAAEPASTASETDGFAPIWGVDEAFARLPISIWLEVSRPPGRDITPDMLTMDRLPRDVSSDDPAILSIHNEYGGLHFLQIHTIRLGSCPGGERCPICFEGNSDELVMLQCVDVMDRSTLSYARRPLKIL
ncbi:hypothetical protein PENFLA_c080G09586 [Penicillium flavigenum]|uniref:Uncharacterized protein n=1 Tax=Penicillium flavigenum TaxID=254877 RepID=A0A1V6SAT3_9EURO|nr:hypothetical protein PENFLA_c080G09586 [Penicillium flavigenum]